MTVLRVAAVQAAYVLMDRDAPDIFRLSVDVSPRPAVTELSH